METPKAGLPTQEQIQSAPPPRERGDTVVTLSPFASIEEAQEKFLSELLPLAFHCYREILTSQQEKTADKLKAAEKILEVVKMAGSKAQVEAVGDKWVLPAGGIRELFEGLRHLQKGEIRDVTTSHSSGPQGEVPAIREGAPE